MPRLSPTPPRRPPRLLWKSSPRQDIEQEECGRLGALSPGRPARLLVTSMRTIVWLRSAVVAGFCAVGAILWLSTPLKESVTGAPARPEPVLEPDSDDIASVPDDTDRMELSEDDPVVTEEVDPVAAARLQEGVEARQAELREALVVAAQIADLSRRNEALAALCYHWAELDPRGALEIALAHRLHEAPGAVIANLAQQWAVIDFTAARKWIDEQPPSDLRSDLVARIGLLWAKSDPEAAADYVLSKTTPGPAQEEAAISVLHQWALRDRVAARAWASKFPQGELRERALWETQGDALK